MKKSLSFDQVKRLIALTAASDTNRGNPENRALFLAVLLCGAKARTWTWEDALSDVLQMPFAVYYALRDMACEKKLSIFPFSHAGFIPSAHVINGPRLQNAVFTATGRTALTTQEVTRRLKVYARRAGINPGDVSLRTLANTHQSFSNLYEDADQIAELLGIADRIVTTETGRASITGTTRTATSVGAHLSLTTGARVDRDPRLHGLNRRSSSIRPR